MIVQQDNILELYDIVKLYPGVTALDKVSIAFRRGEVHALVGENGAGKSTLIKCITGCVEPTSGSIVYGGRSHASFTPTQAIAEGICAVYQEFNLIPFLSVAENIFYGRERKKGLFLDKEGMNRETSEILAELGMVINPKTRIKDLAVAHQQVVEIAKSISRNARLLILDEPSASLTEREIEAMSQIIQRLKIKGVTILYISHRLEEIFTIADHVSVMRDGKYITTLPVAETDKRSLISLMVGRDLAGTFPERNASIGDVILEVHNLRNAAIKDVSFTLRKGEILGLGGLVGAGRTETARALFGADAISTGEVFLAGRRLVVRSPQEAIENGIGLIPEDRKRQGVLLVPRKG